MTGVLPLPESGRNLPNPCRFRNAPSMGEDSEQGMERLSPIRMVMKRRTGPFFPEIRS